MAKKKTKLIIATKEVGAIGNIKRDLPFNVVGNCRLSENRRYLSIRLNGEIRAISYYLGILKTDIESIKQNSLSVCDVSMLEENSSIIVGTARQTKNQNGISLRVNVNNVIRYLNISNIDLNEIMNRRNYIGRIIEFKNTQEKTGYEKNG